MMVFHQIDVPLFLPLIALSKDELLSIVSTSHWPHLYKECQQMKYGMGIPLETYREGLWGYILFPFLLNVCPNGTSRTVCLPLETYREGYRGNPLPSITLLNFLKSAAPEKLLNRKQARDDVACHTRRRARGVARIGCKHCHVHKPSCQGTTPRCSTFTFLLTRLTTIGKNYNLSFFLACMIFLMIVSARSSSLGEPQWRESYFSRLCTCCVNSWHANNQCRFVWQSYPRDWSYTCKK